MPDPRPYHPTPEDKRAALSGDAQRWIGFGSARIVAIFDRVSGRSFIGTPKGLEEYHTQATDSVADLYRRVRDYGTTRSSGPPPNSTERRAWLEVLKETREVNTSNLRVAEQLCQDAEEAGLEPHFNLGRYGEYLVMLERKGG